MIKRLIPVVFLLFLVTGCAPRQEIIQQPTADYSGKYRPSQYNVFYADGVNPDESMKLYIKTKLEEYIIDKSWWGENRKDVRLSITITHIETASRIATALSGPASPLVPPGQMEGQVTIYCEDKEVGKYNISSSYRTFWLVAVFANLDDRIAGKFISQVMDVLR